MNMSVFCFDFAGCGMSEGEYVSLGYHESDDLEIVVDYLRKLPGRVSTIGLWGRSMGAVTALMYAEKDLSIGGMVLDSPFSDLKVLVKDLAKSNTKAPSLVISGALKFVKASVQKRAGFDLTTVKPIAHVGHCYVPALFAVAKDDELVTPGHHGELLYEKYAGDKNIVKFEGGHNGERPNFFMDSASIFLQNTLRVSQKVQAPSIVAKPTKNPEPTTMIIPPTMMDQKSLIEKDKQLLYDQICLQVLGSQQPNQPEIVMNPYHPNIKAADCNEIKQVTKQLNQIKIAEEEVKKL